MLKVNSTFVLIIGAGQAGLAAAYYLQQQNINFVIVDETDRIGNSWRNRYASLTLFTPNQYSALPGLALSGHPNDYASKDQFADYLESYANTMNFPIRLGCKVQSLTQLESGAYIAQFKDQQEIQASHVIVATGAFQQPIIAEVAQQFNDSVLHFTAESIATGQHLPENSRVLVVGDGASGRDIAVLMRQNNYAVLLATGKKRKLFPERILGKSIWWWLKKLHLLRASPTSFLGRLMRKRDPFPNRERSLSDLQQLGVQLVPRLVAAHDSTAIFLDQQQHQINAVIWTIGYQDDSSWLQIEHALTEQGAFIHHEGVSNIKNLFYIGRPWQRNRASALIMGVADDAQRIVAAISARR
ncbi:flavin-containing monooxygenase [Acinetobacter rudis]|uniref:flavin-containing monooxygenase n=1 Tax=Acinetobacter rudis TaxID=632955 RepID=UPI00333F8991